MPRTGRPKQALELSDSEREQLVRSERRRKSSLALALRSRIVLKCAEGRANKEVAADRVGRGASASGHATVVGELRLDGLCDDPRPGRPPTITARAGRGGAGRDALSPLRRTRRIGGWSQDGRALGAVGVDDRSDLAGVRAGTAPHETFKLSNDPLFVEKVYDIVGLTSTRRKRRSC